MAAAGHPVKVTCVHPGYIKTPLIHNASTATALDKNALAAVFDKVAITSPERTAQDHPATRSQSNKARVLPGADAKLFDAIVRVMGSGYMRVLGADEQATAPADALMSRYGSSPSGCSARNASATNPGSVPSST